MKTLLTSAMALGAMTSMAMAGPVELTEKQMDNVTAGLLPLTLVIVDAVDVNNNNVAVAVPVNAAVAGVCVIAGRCRGDADADQRPGRIQ